MTARIAELLSPGQARQRALGEAGRRNLQRLFSRDAILEHYLSLYGRLAGTGA